eukprot:353538-Chlamydomonas_euryale.AAC.3
MRRRCWFIYQAWSNPDEAFDLNPAESFVSPRLCRTPGQRRGAAPYVHGVGMRVKTYAFLTPSMRLIPSQAGYGSWQQIEFRPKGARRFFAARSHVFASLCPSGARRACRIAAPVAAPVAAHHPGRLARGALRPPRAWRIQERASAACTKQCARGREIEATAYLGSLTR